MGVDRLLQRLDPLVIFLTLWDLLEHDVAEDDVIRVDVAGDALEVGPELAAHLDELFGSFLILEGCLGAGLDLVKRLSEKGEEMKKRDSHENQLGGIHEDLGSFRGSATVSGLRPEKVAVIVLLLLHEFLQVEQSLAVWQIPSLQAYGNDVQEFLLHYQDLDVYVARENRHRVEGRNGSPTPQGA